MVQAMRMIAGKAVRAQRGFTLIELLMTIALLAIIATIAIPNFQVFVASNRQAAEFNKVLVGFHYARSEAVKKREEIRVDVESSSGRWVMQVLDEDDGVIRVTESKDGELAVDTVTVTFNSLGRLSGCTNAGEEVSPCEISVGTSLLEVNAAGNIDKAG